jgi:hypothetical protein
MNPCERKWQVEAARDGRLTGKDLESALRHRATCSECAAEQRALTALSQGLAELPLETQDPLTLRRARQRLLAEFNGSLLEPKRSRPAFRAALILGLAAALIGVATHWARHRTASTRLDAGGPSVQVEAQPGALWQEHRVPNFDRIELSEGEALFRVRRQTGQRVLIQLPDGEVEDIGTVFRIRVHERHTTQISVLAGRVSVRLHGGAPFTLGAGEHWQESAAVPVLPAPNKHVEPITESFPGAAQAPKTAHSVTPIAQAHASASSSSPVMSAAPTSNSEPGPSNAEDVAYLAIVDLLQHQRYAEARSAAKDYLLRFPNGFRRVEVLNIATRDRVPDGGQPEP